MAKEERVLPSRLTPVGNGKDFLAFLIDFAFAVVVAVGLYYSFGLLILGNNDYYPAIQAQNEYVMSSGLLKETETSGRFALFDYKDDAEGYAYAKYVDTVWTFFTDTLPTKAEFSANVTVASSVDGKALPAFTATPAKDNAEYLKWVYQNYFRYEEGSSENIFAPSVDGDYASKPAPTGAYTDLTQYSVFLKNKLLDMEKGTGFYMDTVLLFNAQPTLRNISSRISLARHASMLVPYTVAPIIFFFVLPLALKEGKTLGKLFLGISVVGEDGYLASKPRIMLRQGIITFLFFALCIPNTLASILAFGVLLLIAFVSRTMSRTNQPIHDRLARTVAVLAKQSLYFASKEAEEEYLEENPTSGYAKERKREDKDAHASHISAVAEAQERILDLSTINARREEARKMTSFDEFEKASDKAFEEEAKKREEQGKEPMDPKAEEDDMVAAAMLEGLSEEEAKALVEESKEEGDPDGFTDGSPEGK